WLYAVVSHGWLAGIHDGAADALWAVGAARTPARTRPGAETALDAPARAALCAGGQDRAAPAVGGRDAPRGVWLPGGRQSRPGPTRVAHQHGLRGADQPHHPSACRRGRATGQHAVQGRRRVAAAVGRVPLLLQFLLAPRELTPAPAAARAYPRRRLGQAVAAPDTSHGRRADRPCVDPARGAALPRAAVATASAGVRKREQERDDGLL